MGKTKEYSIYLSCVTFIQNILTVIILIPFNFIVLCKYKKFIKKKQMTIYRIMPVQPVITRSSSNSIKKLNAQQRFTKMILIVSFLFILSRLGEASIKVADLIFIMLNANSNYSVYFAILNMFVEFNTCFIISMNFFILFSFNKPFRDFFKVKFFCRNKILK